AASQGKPAPSKRERGFTRGFVDSGVTPLISAIDEQGGLRSRPKDYSGGEYDDAPTVGFLRGFAPVVWGGKGGIAVDEMAQIAFEEGLLPEASVPLMWQEIFSEVTTFRNLREELQ